MTNAVEGGLLSVGAFVVLFGAAVVVMSALGVELAPADGRSLLVVLAIAALFVGFNA